jgi:hypothetical protein
MPERHGRSERLLRGEHFGTISDRLRPVGDPRPRPALRHHRQFAPPFQARHPLAGSWSVCISASLSSAVAYACLPDNTPELLIPGFNYWGLDTTSYGTDVAHTQLDQIAASELAVHRQVN